VHGLICDPQAAFEPFFPELMPGIYTVHAAASAGPQEAHSSHRMGRGGRGSSHYTAAVMYSTLASGA
jgi:hypothetical protein